MRKLQDRRLLALAPGFLVATIATATFTGLSVEARAGRKTPAYFAMAVNPDYVGYFIVTGRRSARAAGKVVMRECGKATAGNCELVIASQGRFLALGYSPAGNLNFAIDDTQERATAALDAECTAKFGGACAPEQNLDLSMSAIIASPVEPRRHAAVAFGNATGSPLEQDGRAWIASGRATAAEAVTAAMQRCAAALGESNCRYYTGSGKTHIALYRDAGGRSGGMQIHLSQQLVIGAVDRICRQDGLRCEIIALVASSDVRDQEYDLNRMKGVPL